MSLKGIFGLFGVPEDDDKFKKEVNDSLDVFKETPYFKVGMFCKMIKNGSNFTKQLFIFFILIISLIPKNIIFKILNIWFEVNKNFFYNQVFFKDMFLLHNLVFL